MKYLFIGYIILISLISFIVMGIDKSKARRRARRIPEAALFTLAVFGGSPGILLGMYIFRHKTKHNSFRIGIPVIILVQAYLIFRLL